MNFIKRWYENNFTIRPEIQPVLNSVTTANSRYRHNCDPSLLVDLGKGSQEHYRIYFLYVDRLSYFIGEKNFEIVLNSAERVVARSIIDWVREDNDAAIRDMPELERLKQYLS